MSNLKIFKRLVAFKQFSIVFRTASTATRTGPYQQTRIGVVGAPFDRGQRIAGTEVGPKICRDSGFISFLTDALSLDVKDFGDIDFGLEQRKHSSAQTVQTSVGHLKNVPEVARANQLISDAVRKILLEDRISLTLGGDHSIAIGSIHGVSQVYDDLAVLWVDAHADINAAQTTSSGNLHGMPLSFLIKELEPYTEKLPGFDWLTPRISAKNIAYIGLRDVDFSERCFIDKLGISAYSMADIDRHGIRAVTKMALDKITADGRRPLHLSFDIDVLDDTEVPTTGTAVPGGLTLREAHVLIEEVHSTQLMVSMDMVEVNPVLGTPENVKRTTNIVRQLLTAIFGNQRGGITGGMTVTPL